MPSESEFAFEKARDNRLEHLWLYEMTWPEVERVRSYTDIVLIPVGSTEQHGPHLPLGCDTIIPSRFAEEIARRTGVPIAPPIWFSTAESHMGFPGTISLRPTTLMTLLGDISWSLARHGFVNQILLNGHQGGANPAILSATDEIQILHPEIRLWTADLMQTARTEVFEICTSEVLNHAEEIEVSEMLVIRPELVHPELAVPNVPRSSSRLLGRGENSRGLGNRMLGRSTGADSRARNPLGHSGDPTVGTAEKGQRLIDALASNVVMFIEDLRAGQVRVANANGVAHAASSASAIA
jgi:creatinine amidohydrolase